MLKHVLGFGSLHIRIRCSGADLFMQLRWATIICSRWSTTCSSDCPIRKKDIMKNGKHTEKTMKIQTELNLQCRRSVACSSEQPGTLSKDFSKVSDTVSLFFSYRQKMASTKMVLANWLNVANVFNFLIPTKRTYGEGELKWFMEFADKP